MTPKQYAVTFARFWWLILIVSVLGCGVGATQNDEAADYTSSARVTVVPTKVHAADANERYLASVRAAQAVTIAKSRMPLYATIVDDPGLLTRLNDMGNALSASDISKRVEVSLIPDSASLTVSYSDPDASRTQQLAGQVAEAMAAMITGLEKERAGETILRARAVGQPSVPTTVTQPPSWRNPLIGLVAGIALGLALAVLAGRLDTKVRGSENVEELLGAPVLGVVPALRREGRRAAAASDGRDPIEEVRTNVYFHHPSTPGALRIAVTAVAPLQGTADLTAALADSLADTGARVLLVDAQTEGRSAQARPRDPGSAGLVDVASGDQGVPMTNDHVYSTAFGEFLDRSAAGYDFLVVATDPILSGGSALAIAARTDLTLVATRRRGTRRRQLSRARADLARVNARVAGAVIVS